MLTFTIGFILGIISLYIIILIGIKLFNDKED